MAFGEHRGNHWLLIPAVGIAIMIAAAYDILPTWLGSQQRLLTCGGLLTVVGIVCAGLFGHIIWLVPIALLLASPLMALFWMQEKCSDWRRKHRAIRGAHGMVQDRQADEPSDARKSPFDRKLES